MLRHVVHTLLQGAIPSFSLATISIPNEIREIDIQEGEEAKIQDRDGTVVHLGKLQRGW
jgi:hypothetical protein